MAPFVEERSESPGLGKSMKKSNKPEMEKRRRERINTSLNQLKTLVLEALNKDTSQYSKLEKADILEMTVRHLRGEHTKQSAAPDKFRVGYTECAAEVARYLTCVDGLSTDIRARLLRHLSATCQRVSSQPQTVTSQHPSHVTLPVATQPAALPGATIVTASHHQMNRVQQLSPAHQVSAAQQVSPSNVTSFQVIPSQAMASPAIVTSPTIATSPTLVLPATLTSPAGLYGHVTPLYINTQCVNSTQLSATAAATATVQQQVLTSQSQKVHQPQNHTQQRQHQVQHSQSHQVQQVEQQQFPEVTSVVSEPALQPSYHHEVTQLSHKQHLANLEVPTHQEVMLREEKVWRPW